VWYLLVADGPSLYLAGELHWSEELQAFFLLVWYYWFGCIAYDVLFLYYCFFQSTEYIESWGL
jgi:hypothetical protein